MPNKTHTTPLADRMRPQTLDQFVGQEQVIGPGKLLRQAIEQDQVPSIIFWGPPACGKTTLAFIIAESTKAEFRQISAVSSGVKDLREIIQRAEENQRLGGKTILFIDEIHRWNKAQQDALLPHVERGVVTLIGATTENPSFEVRSALLSRCRVFVLDRHADSHIQTIINSAVSDKNRGLGNQNIKIDKKVIELLSRMSNGDARTALNVLEYAVSVSAQKESPPNPLLRKEGESDLSPYQGENKSGVSPLTKGGQGGVREVVITPEIIQESFQKSHLLYDKDGDEHYNIISALHKSMRGSDADASLYWLARMLEAGEDPLYIARRVVRFASEDIGLANSRALEQAIAAYQACHLVGMPECNLALAQAVVYMAKCKKSNDLYTAYQKVQKDIKDYGNLPVPKHIRNAPTQLMKDLDYGKGYKYSPDHDYQEEQDYLPDELKDRKYL